MKILPMFIDEKLIELINLRGGEKYLKAILTEAVLNDYANLNEAKQLGFKDDNFKDYYEWEMPLYKEARDYLSKNYDERIGNVENLWNKEK